METAERIEQYKNSVSENFGSLSLGIFAVSLIGSVPWATIVLIIFGVIFALCGISMKIPLDLKQEWFLRKVATPERMAIFKSLGWFIVLIMFGYSLIQTSIVWLIVIGILFAISAYVVLFISILRLKDNKSTKLTDA